LALDLERFAPECQKLPSGNQALVLFRIRQVPDARLFWPEANCVSVRIFRLEHKIST